MTPFRILCAEPRQLAPQLRVRERAHEKLDEILDMYEQGAPLWLEISLGWADAKRYDIMRITIRPHDGP